MKKTTHLKQERTIILIKPDGVKRGLIGEIISRIEKRGLKIIALEMFQATRDQIDKHYPKDKKWITRIGEKTLKNFKDYNTDVKKQMKTDDPFKIGKMVRGWLITFMVSGPMVKIVVEGIHAIEMVRKIVGSSLPSEADMGTIRGDFSVDDATAANRDKRAIHNIVHASENPSEAKHELALWFSIEDIFDYKRAEEDIMF
ncbi:nucleoside-diphosphate kinase [bacterium (Candidatus Gribaldobacteria) CG10_big_fil_rev_8_21_14_0_10_33_41]|nr:MAG: nucleoside-diphosphate kinase [bacterium (Candidatus Gribaldobacteria) CG10_big_fil_rev_8_21_14_0_10_33_41]